MRGEWRPCIEFALPKLHFSSESSSATGLHCMGSMNPASARTKSRALAKETVPNEAEKIEAIDDQMLMRTV
jgi:hypothetical protein